MEKNSIHKIVMYYDSTCTFCRWCKEFIEKRSRQTIVYTHTDDTDTITVISPEGTRFTKYAASIYLGKQLHQPWRFLAHVFYYVPHPLGDMTYDFVKRNRSLLVRVFTIK